MPTAQPLGVTCLLLGTGPSFLSSSSRHWSSCYHDRGEDVVERLRDGSRLEAVVTMLRAQEKVVRDCRADHSLFPFARGGLWGKLSDWTEFLVRCSSPAEQSDSRDAHFLSGAEKCCASLPAHCRTSRFRIRPARRGVSRRHNFLCPASGFRLRPWSSLLASRRLGASTSSAPLRVRAEESVTEPAD